MKPIQNVLTRLTNARVSGEGKWQACCPAHDDSRASLSVSETADGTVLLNCHAGCDNTKVVKALKMKLSDLFPPRAKAISHKKIVAKCDYHDAEGALLFQVVRYDPKDFRQRKPNGDGWSWSVKDCPRVPYRLPELLASDPDADVFVPEGEKDVDRLRSLGLVATCNAGGASKWKADHAKYLKGRKVVVVPDNDFPGRKHADQVAHSLIGIASSTKVLSLAGLPAKCDVSDYIDAGGNAAGLLKSASDTVEWSPIEVAEIESAEADEDLGDGEGPQKQSTADKLVELALNRYRIGRTECDEAFAVENDGPNIAIMFRGSRDALRSALARQYRNAYGRTPNATALADAITTLQGDAYVADHEQVHLRVAEHDGGIVIDLGDRTGKAVVVKDGDWQIVGRSPVLFRRTAATGELPAPERGGNLDDLCHLLNVTTETWPLVVGWLVAALVPEMPHPILMLGGQQGTGKTSGGKKLIGVIDPSPAALRSQPRDPETWAISASASWLVGCDNVSHISEWWSDSLCKAVTGDGWLRRKLYTDGDLAVLSFRRVILLTSIDAGALRGDLGDRVLLVDLEPIDETQRRSEREIDRQYEAARPRIFGALLDLLAKAWAELPRVEVDRLPRMADFARLLAAIQMVTSDDSDNCCSHALKIYLGQKDRIAESVIESDGVAMAIVDLVEAGREWEGTAAELLAKITPEKRPKDWPRTPQAVGGRIKRLAPALMQLGIEVTVSRTARKRIIRLVGSEAQANVTNATTSQAPENTAVSGDELVTSGDNCDNGHALVVTTGSSIFPEESRQSDECDECDNQMQFASFDDLPSHDPFAGTF